jgi:hypothetical protein
VDKIILSLKKRFLLPVIVVAGCLAWLGLCRAYYASYWAVTIARVQTVDFNLLHHTLPVTLSYLVLNGQDEAVQRVLDSSYGLFGLVVTDPAGREIVYKTERVYKGRTWQKQLSVDYLSRQEEPFDLLLAPPPLAAEYQHDSPRTSNWKRAGEPPRGRVIGRVYYLRGVPPAFAADLVAALTSNWLVLSGSNRGYVLLTLNVIGFGLALALLVLWRQSELESKARELERMESDLLVRRKALDTLNVDLTAQRQRKEWLEEEADLAYRRAIRLKQSLEKLKDAFFLEVEGEPSRSAERQGLVRPPLYPPSAVIQEVEVLLPELTQNAKILRSQAEVLSSYCAQLESRQAEMQKLFEQSQLYFGPTGGAATLIRSAGTPSQGQV